MKYSHCVDCGKEKLTCSAQRRVRCYSCSHKGKTASEETKKKMSEAHTGRPATIGNTGKVASIETRRKMSIANGGNGIPQNYLGLKTWTSRNKLKTPFCEWCYSEDNLEAHHIMPKGRFPQYATDDSNCRVMCKSCHTFCHKQGGF